jgi:hypothetical protein
MKKLFLVFLVAMSFMSCNNDDNSNNEEANNTIIGRWHIVGFEQNTMWDFKNNLKYTIYSTNGVFGPTETSAIPNPNPWSIENEAISIDLHFGNMLNRTLNFSRNGNVVKFMDANGDVSHILYREGYNYTN